MLRLGHAQVLQLWEVLWAHSWQQRRRSDHEPAAAGDLGHPSSPADSPVKGDNSSSSPAAGSLGAGQEARSKEGAAAGSRMQVVADGRGPSQGEAKGQDKGSAAATDRQQQPHLDLFICFVAAVVQAQRRALLDHCYNADDVLRLFHGVRRVDLWQCLDKAHALLDALHSKAQRP